MNEAITPGIRFSEEESRIIGMLNSGKASDIREALTVVGNNKNLMSIESLKDYCVFAQHHLERGTDPDVYQPYLSLIAKSVENHGLSRNGHFDDHAKRLLDFFHSPEYGHLLAENEMLRESVRIVQEHYGESKHSSTYEMRLNHLHEVAREIEKRERKAS